MTDLVLYDGVCGLCNRTVTFILRRDRTNRFRFAPAQGPTAREILARHGRNPDALETFYVVADDRLYERGDAVRRVVAHLGGAWPLLRFVPRPLLNAGYDFVARRRLRWFGRLDACPLPDPAWREKFIDLTPPAGAGAAGTAKDPSGP